MHKGSAVSTVTLCIRLSPEQNWPCCKQAAQQHVPEEIPWILSMVLWIRRAACQRNTWQPRRQKCFRRTVALGGCRSANWRYSKATEMALPTVFLSKGSANSLGLISRATATMTPWQPVCCIIRSASSLVRTPPLATTGIRTAALRCVIFAFLT